VDFCKRLQELMDERRMTIYALSKKSNVSWNTIKNFFAKETKPTLPTIELLCNGLEITMAQFFDESGDTVVLTAEQQHLLARWNVITSEEKQLISNMLDVMISKK